MLGGSNYMAEAEQALLGLGLKERFRPSHNGAQRRLRMRIELAKILLRSCSSTNQQTTDIESIQWLETFLAGYPEQYYGFTRQGFLDNVTKRHRDLLGKYRLQGFW
jgi:ATPase subunit of ABC transporter with duplicated ATPase domains